MTFSMATSLLNLAEHDGHRHVHHRRSSRRWAPRSCRSTSARRRWSPLVWLVLALVPISALFSALSLAIAAFARSSKEGQYYLMPLLMISLPLMMLPMLPATSWTWASRLIPLTGLMLLLRALIEGQYCEALRYSVPGDRRDGRLLPAGDSLGRSTSSTTNRCCSARASGSAWACGCGTWCATARTRRPSARRCCAACCSWSSASSPSFVVPPPHKLAAVRHDDARPADRPDRHAGLPDGDHAHAPAAEDAAARPAVVRC